MVSPSPRLFQGTVLSEHGIISYGVILWRYMWVFLIISPCLITAASHGCCSSFLCSSKFLSKWLFTYTQDYGVYIGDRQQPLLRLERSASSLLGVVRYGVHVNGYFINCSSELNGINNSKANGSSMGNSKSQPSPICKVSAGARLLGEYDPSTVMMWLGVRSLNKPTWPGMLDNIVSSFDYKLW